MRSLRPGPGRARRNGFERPVPFWLGAACCCLGVLLHLPMFFMARDMHYQLAGMAADAPMVIGMILIFAGLALSLYGLVPRGRAARVASGPGIRIQVPDDAPVRPAHVALLVVMAIAVTIDVMKPATLAFVIPGVAQEYGLRSPANPYGFASVAWLPLIGIAGTVVGSLIWGPLADRIGRRAALLLAGMTFVTTSVCGVMPSFAGNLVMCFFMGLGAGGMLPVTFALLAETVPGRHRGWLTVLIGGDIAGAYLITSCLAGWLAPVYSWRVLWLVGLPTGLVFIALNRWIPESPRYLLARGRRREAQAVMDRYGAVADRPIPRQRSAPAPRPRFMSVIRRWRPGPAAAITVMAVGIGVATYGFQLWVPTNLQHLGYSETAADHILRNAAILALPLTALIALVHHLRGPRSTVLVVSAVTAASLAGFAIVGDSLAGRELVLSLILVIPLAGTGSAAAVLAGYVAEVRPALGRGRATGYAAGLTRVGGVAVLILAVAAASLPTIRTTALVGAVSLAAAALVFAWLGPAPRRRSPGKITSEPRGARA